MSEQANNTPAPAAPAEGNANTPVVETPATEQPPVPRRLKVGDREVDEEEVIRGYQKVSGADEKFREASRIAHSRLT